MNAADVLFYGNRTVLMTVGNIPAGEWDTPNVCGWWSCRQIMAHLASFEFFLGEVLDTYLGGEFGPVMTSMSKGGQAFNDEQVAAREGMDAQAVMREYESAVDAVREKILRIPDETRRQAGLIPWYGPEYDLEDLIAYMFYGHKREHMSQVNLFLDQFKS